MVRIFCLLLLGVSLNSVAAPTKLHSFAVALDWYVNPDHAPILVAKQQGYFKKYGLKVYLIAPPTISEPEQLVAANKVDVAITYQAHLLLNVQAGMPLVRFASLINKPTDCIAVLRNSGITKLSQLKGKTLGNSGSGLAHSIVSTMLEHNGLRSDQVKMVDVKMNLVQALLTRRVTAISGLSRNVEPLELASMGFKTNLFYSEDNGVPPYDELILVANKNNYRKHKAEFIAFDKAMRAGYKYLIAHPNKAWREVSATYKDYLAPTRKMANINHLIWLASLRYFDPHPTYLNKVKYKNFAKFMQKKGLLHKPIPLSDYAV